MGCGSMPEDLRQKMSQVQHGYNVNANGCGERTFDQIADEIETLSHGLRRKQEGLRGVIQAADAIMHLAADIRLDAEKSLETSTKHISVNGRTLSLYMDTITYEEVVRLSEKSGNPEVMVLRQNSAEFLKPGQSVQVEEGLRFDVGYTDNA
jgi:hypothetical protein